jgi:hypothetical protein
VWVLGRAWPTWDRFVLDPALRLLGMQSDVAHPDVNLLVFEHDCGSSISVLTRRLRRRAVPGTLPPSRGPGGVRRALAATRATAS